MFGRRQTQPLPTAEEALPGRAEPWFALPGRHTVLDAPLVSEDVPVGLEVAVFGLGCFWGAEEIFWKLPGVWSTSVGYVGGHTPYPSYEEVCSGRTGHTEAVRVVYDPEQVGYDTLVKTFFEVHDPTQGMRQGNDEGSQYRSMILTTTATQEETARDLAARYQGALTERGLGQITTEIRPLDAGADSRYFYAEEVHQQYLHKVPHGYRCHANTGVAFPE